MGEGGVGGVRGREELRVLTREGIFKDRFQKDWELDADDEDDDADVPGRVDRSSPRPPKYRL